MIKAKEENVVTEKGVRAFIMERLLNSPFSKGAVLDIDKKTVEVRLEGEEKQIKAFMRELEKALLAEFGNPTVSFSAFQENACLETPKLSRSSQALVVGQLQKGIGVQLEILKTLRQSEQSQQAIIETLKKSETSQQSIKQSIDYLPERIARAFRESQAH